MFLLEQERTLNHGFGFGQRTKPSNLNSLKNRKSGIVCRVP